MLIRKGFGYVCSSSMQRSSRSLTHEVVDSSSSQSHAILCARNLVEWLTEARNTPCSSVLPRLTAQATSFTRTPPEAPGFQSDGILFRCPADIFHMISDFIFHNIRPSNDCFIVLRSNVAPVTTFASGNCRFAVAAYSFFAFTNEVRLSLVTVPIPFLSDLVMVLRINAFSH